MFLRSLIWIIAAAFTLLACDSEKSKKVRLDSLHSFERLMDSVEFAFDSITSIEQRKFFLVKRIADELQYSALVPLATISDLQVALNRVKSIPYTSKSIAESALIDRYDLAMDSLTNQLVVCLGQIERINEFPVLLDMEQEFMTLRESTLPVRIYYDDFAIRATYTLRALKAAKHKDFAAVQDMPEPPLFQLMPI